MTQSQLKSILNYDPLTGIFTWKNTSSLKVKIGQRAGSLSKVNGYRVININKKLWREHRLAFLYMKGFIPEFIDHKDRNRSNNKWNNLREATRSQNSANREKDFDNTSNYKGVHFAKDRKHLSNPWLAYIKINSKKKHIGYFESAEIAAIERDKEAIKLYNEFAFLNFPNKNYE